jgi:inositol transporter-like SP family MFS transporter
MTHGRADEVGEAARQLGLEGETAPVTREKSEWRRLFAPGALRRFAFITPIYVLWGIPAGPSAFFLPCIFKTTGATTAAGGDLMEMLWSFSAIVAVIVIFMPLTTGSTAASSTP